MIPPTLVFFLKMAEAIWGLFQFHINFWSTCSRSGKYAIGILVGIVLNLLIALGIMDIVMLILRIYEDNICFHLFVFSSIFSSVFYNFPSTGLLPPWLNLFLGTLFLLLL